MPTPAASQYDLTPRMAPFLDRHLVFPLLEFLSKNEVYAEKEITASLFELFRKTNMVDFIHDTHVKLHGENVSKELQEERKAIKDRRPEVVAQLRALDAECKPLLVLLDDEALLKKLRAEGKFTIEALAEKDEKVTAATVESLYAYAKFQFECGIYGACAEYLHNYRALSTDTTKTFNALWGKFAAEILLLEWENARDELKRLKEYIDSAHNGLQPAELLQQRVWLIHWSLFVFFNHKDGRNGIIDLFFHEKYINAIQTACPWILRYLTTAVITNKRRRNVLKDLVTVIQQERYTYRDPITEFVECLYVNFDFEVAQQKLRECEEVLANDFFLVACREDFIENARLFIFETYCRIHQCIDIPMLAEKLNMDQAAAERWIVNLIRNASLDAKIDSKQNHVIMGTQYPSIYQQVIQKTKNLSFQSNIMQSNIERREAEMKSARATNND